MRFITAADTTYIYKKNIYFIIHFRPLKMDNNFFEIHVKFKNLETTLQIKIVYEEINSSQNSGNACYHLVENVLSYTLLQKRTEMGLYKTTEWSKSFSAGVIYLRQRNFSAYLYNLDSFLNISVRIGLPYLGKNIRWRCSRIEFRGQYLGL